MPRHSYLTILLSLSLISISWIMYRPSIDIPESPITLIEDELSLVLSHLTQNENDSESDIMNPRSDSKTIAGYFNALWIQDSLVYWSDPNIPYYRLSDSSSHRVLLAYLSDQEILLYRKHLRQDQSAEVQGIHLRTFISNLLLPYKVKQLQFTRKKEEAIGAIAYAKDQSILVSAIALQEPFWYKAIRLFLFVCGTIILFRWTRDLLRQYNWPRWISTMLYSALTFVMSMLLFHVPSWFYHTSDVSDPFFTSLFYLGYVAHLFHQYSLVWYDISHRFSSRWLSGLTLMFFFSTITICAFSMQEIIVQFEQSWSIERILQWEPKSIFAILGIIVINSFYFLSCYYVILALRQMVSSFWEKLAFLGGVSVLFLPAYFLFSLPIHPFSFFLLSYIFFILLDLFCEFDTIGGLTWPFIWISILSISTSLLLIAFTIHQKESILIESLQSLSRSRPAKPLSKFAWYEYQSRKSIQVPGSFPSTYPLDEVPEKDEIIRQSRSGQVYFARNLSDEVIICAKRSRIPLSTPISLYAYLFFFWTALVAVLFFINHYIRFFPASWTSFPSSFPSLRKRIQFYILAVTVGSFLILSLITYIFYYQHKRTQEREQHQRIHKKIEEEWSDEIFDRPKFSLPNPSELSLHFYSKQGRKLDGGNGSPPYFVPYDIYQSLPHEQYRFIAKDHKMYSWLQKKDTNQLIVETVIREVKPEAPLIDSFISKLLNLYLFFFVIATGIAVAISNSITAPLKVLSQKLKQIKVGRKNEPLSWKAKDELGELIQDYNRMIEQLEESANMLAVTERETAWREMAKQVAHEIKNPLTPMKLSIQHLQFSIQEGHEIEVKTVQKVTDTLLEQIEALTRIASEFSNFAKMPAPENQAVNLNAVVSSIHDLFRKREDMDIYLSVPLDDLIVFADRNHIMRVMNNLLKNAIQAIPTDRRGSIHIKLYKKDRDAVIEVRDNGIGIAEEVKNKVFSPNFTSKSSGTGLGLAICANLIEGCNGNIHFETIPKEGTTFYVKIPLMHMDKNFKEDKRVIL